MQRAIVTFVVLAAVVGVELVVHGAAPDRATRDAALSVLAGGAVLFAGLYAMRIGQERRAVKVLVVVPLLLPALYALALILEAHFRGGAV